MFKHFHQKYTKSYFTLSWVLLLLTILWLLWPAHSNAATLFGGGSSGRMKAVAPDPILANAPCQGLKPFNNLDELLYQLYINLGRNCLFQMSTEELEKSWDIKILDRSRKLTGQSRASSDFYNKPYKSEKDSFYVEISRHPANFRATLIYINITKEFKNKHFSLFPIGTSPKLLPKPQEFYSMLNNGYNPTYKSTVEDDRPGWSGYEYFWSSSDGWQMLWYSPSYGINRIVMGYR